MLKDQELLVKLKECLSTERKIVAEFLRHLMEVDRRRLYAKQGYESLYAFLTRGLNLSEGTAYRRTLVARTARVFPGLLQALEKGDLHLTGAAVLAPILTQDSSERLIAQARGKSRKQIESLIFELSPVMANLPTDRIRRLSISMPPAIPTLPLLDSAQNHTSTGGGDVDNFHAEGANSTRSIRTSGASNSGPRLPLPPAPRRVSIHFVADEEFLKCLERARELLRPKFPEGRLEDVFNEALRLYLEKKDPERRYSTSREAPYLSVTRYIPASLKSVVWRRDGGRCTFVSAEGVRCEARSGIEIDHKIPFAKGGLTTESNLRLLCRTHNQLQARAEFGDPFIDRKINA